MRASISTVGGSSSRSSRRGGPSRPSTKKFHPPRYEAYYEPDPLSASRRSRQGCGTCPLTGDFAAKWHRRINGYDSGPSESGDSPPNGITILRSWPAPVRSPMACRRTNIPPNSGNEVHRHKIEGLSRSPTAMKAASSSLLSLIRISQVILAMKAVGPSLKRARIGSLGHAQRSDTRARTEPSLVLPHDSALHVTSRSLASTSTRLHPASSGFRLRQHPPHRDIVPHHLRIPNQVSVHYSQSAFYTDLIGMLHQKIFLGGKKGTAHQRSHRAALDSEVTVKSHSKLNPPFAVNRGFTKSGSSADLRDLAEEARERKKDLYFRNKQAPFVFVPSDATEERRGGVTSDKERRRRRRGSYLATRSKLSLTTGSRRTAGEEENPKP
ncbi:hypothetical protein M5K25_010179 [Dendrobium thyrsiflorum]|uniref:Uncharacterized protein n=1 Tax=Dendrobium thyrsiflorum TaxID=117978 RepID=A0ABD0V059_DENTH